MREQVPEIHALMNRPIIDINQELRARVDVMSAVYQALENGQLPISEWRINGTPDDASWEKFLRSEGLEAAWEKSPYNK